MSKQTADNVVQFKTTRELDRRKIEILLFIENCKIQCSAIIKPEPDEVEFDTVYDDEVNDSIS